MEAEGHTATVMQDDTVSGSEGSVMDLEPLTTRGKQDAINVVEAYGHFWSNIKFTKGWATPPFKREEVEDLLHQAAEYVVRIRNHLDAKDSSMKMRVRDGSAQEFFWGMDWNPKDDPRRFVVELVHATLKDAKGYVEGLSEALVNEYIAEIDEYYSSLPQHHRRHPGRCHDDEGPAPDWPAMVEQMLQKAGKSLDQIRATQMPVGKRTWVTLCGELERVNRRLERVLDALAEEPNSGTADFPMTPVTPVTPLSGNWGKRRRLLRQSHIKDTEKLHAPQDEPQPTVETEGPQPEATEAPHENLPASPTTGSTQHAEPEMAVECEVQGETQTAEEEAVEVEPAAPATTSPEESSSTPDEAQSDSEVRIKIGHIGEQISTARKDVQGLLEECRELDAQRLNNGDGSYLEKLRKRCLWLSHELMENMLSLDQITTADPQERSKKKEQILAIQDILSTVDDLSEKLEAYGESLRQEREEKERKQQEEEERKRQQMEQEKQEREAAVRARLANVIQTVLDEAKWKSLRLEPKFEAIERSDAYVVKSYIPGMLKKNIAVDLADGEDGGRKLVIKGSRLPSQRDIKGMVTQLQTSLQRGHLDIEKLQGLSDEQLLMLLAQGRFGTFVKYYTLPEDVETSSISADYENGVLFVVLPKEVAHPFAPFYAPTSRRSPPARSYTPTPQYPNLADFFW